MAELRSMLKYHVLGFGDHVSRKTVEFLEEPEDMQVCSWCGNVSASMIILLCSHIVCNECHFVASQAKVTVCLIDQKKLPNNTSFHSRDDPNVGDRQVRCLNADGGCGFTGRLADLDGHLRETCAFYLTSCSKCGNKVAYKDVRAHFPTCKSAVGVFIQDRDMRSLLEGLTNIRREIEHALTSSSSDSDGLRTALESARERFDALGRQLAKGVPGHAKAESFGACRLQE